MEPYTTLQELIGIDRYNKAFQAIVDSGLARPSNFTIWVGAGFSAYFARFLNWRQFLSSLCAEIADNDDRSLAQLLIERGRYQIAAEYIASVVPHLAREFIGKHFSDLSSCPIGEDLIIGDFCAKTIVTTNYDLLLERKYPHYRVASPIDDVYTLFSDHSKLLKLHGTVERPDNCVLSVSQYAKTYNRDLDYLLINLITNQNILFIGASLDSGEPYFKHMAHIHANSLSSARRWAVLSFPAVNKAYITNRCNEIQSSYGINVIPYIPNGDNHICFRDILDHLRQRPPSRSAISENLAYVRKRLDRLLSDLSDAGTLLPHYRRLSHICLQSKTLDAQKFEIIAAFEKYTSAIFDPANSKAQAIYDYSVRIGIPFDSLFISFANSINGITVSDSLKKIINGLIKSAERLRHHRDDAFDIVGLLRRLLANEGVAQDPLAQTAT